ncbi:hypothetical protein I3843_03G076600 [Carya illinoinensis]|uniref:Uncharacterized protein n=1 Tax=Carya illinoinensis TaxID=32201 RepID=A0A922FID1_CARIL|nr:hypothetical protein I3842_03G076700 [Carya illinoinensis]KAG7986391.1 hypothetical protein I3843_03G076600 [Carya illinoinensis]
MVYLRFTSFVLGLLFVMHALGNSSACTHQGEEGLAVAARGKNVAVPKGVLLDGGNALGLRKIGFGGRRKMAEQKVSSKEIEVEGEVAKTSSFVMNISCLNAGKDSNASKNSPGRSSQDHKSNKNTLPKASKSAGLGSPRSKLITAHFPNTKPESPQDSKAVPTKASLGSSSRSDKPIFSQETYHDQTTASDHQRDETQRLLEATKEIVSLMHKDYGKMARRPPPSNNHEPWH